MWIDIREQVILPAISSQRATQFPGVHAHAHCNRFQPAERPSQSPAETFCNLGLAAHAGRANVCSRAARRGHIGVLEVAVLYPAACRVLGSTKWESSTADCVLMETTGYRNTDVSPCPTWFRRCAAASDKSTRRFSRRFGPRSVIVTTTDLPFFRLTTRILVPSGKYQLAAVNLWRSNRLPFAIFSP